MADATPRLRRITLAVLPFRPSAVAQSDGDGSHIADDIIVRAIRTGKFSVVERHRIDDVFKELQLTDVAPIDEATAARIGHLVGANVLVFGSYTSSNGQRTVSIRLVKVETGEVLAGDTETGTSSVLKLAGDSFEKIASSVPAN